MGRYYRAERDPAVAVSELEARTSKAKRREQLASQIINTRAMLDRFLAWDGGEPDPVRFRATPVSTNVLGWNMRIGHDLLYATPEGLRLRQLLTDGAIRRGEHLRLFAVASLFTSRLPRLSSASPQLRYGTSVPTSGWCGLESCYLRLIPDLRARLDQVAAGLADDAA